MDRRTLLAIGVAAVLAPRAAVAAAPVAFAIDWQGAPVDPAVAASLDAQIALVRALPIDPAIARFFAEQPITVDREQGTATRAGPRGVFFERRAVPPDNPVLLHELLHRFQLLRLPGGRGNADVLRFFEETKASGRYPADAYMFRNPFEFFAMTASVVLHGRAARPPYRREIVADRSPALFAWIVELFGLRTEGVA